MGSRGMRGYIGKPSSRYARDETLWQKVKRVVWNRFWPQSEYLYDWVCQILPDIDR